MPIYRHFYVELRSQGRWVVPPKLDPSASSFDCDWPYGGFVSAHPRCGWLNLFWGDDPYFCMRQGPPEDHGGSPLLGYLSKFYDFEQNDESLCWIPCRELLLDCWETEKLSVAGVIPAHCAMVFGNGQQSFPAAELNEQGVTEVALFNLRERSWPHPPIDLCNGRERYELSQLPPDANIHVTWRETIATFIGGQDAATFMGLRQYGPEDDLRILSKRG